VNNFASASGGWNNRNEKLMMISVSDSLLRVVRKKKGIIFEKKQKKEPCLRALFQKVFSIFS